MSRKSRLRQFYDITIDEYNLMLAKQGGSCAICKQLEKLIRGDKPQSLSVDHNHRTGKIRGLLCNRCNRILGMVEENIEILRAIINYLKIHA